jgi:formylglycine-generating enzyme required for sulfatase activity
MTTPARYVYVGTASLILALGCRAGSNGHNPAGAEPAGAGAGGAAAGGTDAGGSASGKDATSGSGGDSLGSGGGSGSEDPWSRCEHVAVSAKCKSGWCEVPGGCFVMGSPANELGHVDEQKQVMVTLTRPFMMQATETTQADWTARGFANPSGLQPNGKGDCTDDPQCPVGRVTWFEALEYANALSRAHEPPLEECYVLHGCGGTIGKDHYCSAAEATKPTVYDCAGFRLPTDAEWEYAARAGTRTAFYSGDITVHPQQITNPGACLPDANLERIGWYCHNSGGKSHPVAGLQPNGWGLFDMSGNAEEWVNDRSDGLPARTDVDPDGKVGLHISRNNRGGSFISWSPTCRSASQLEHIWDGRSVGLGFRLVRTGTLDGAHPRQ